jgi:RNA polymerase sigma-70 factor (ECF subfamily)
MSRTPIDGAAALRAPLQQLQQQFLAALKTIRPKLHRFCARMCGSALDGEDVVQETLAHAFYQLPSLQEQSRLEPWLFRIAHRKCIDFLRSTRKQREDTVPYDEDDPRETETELEAQPLSETLAPLVGQLPPKERACVLLKDLLDYQLAEVAEVVDSSVGGVKAALHRGREKLRARYSAPAPPELDPHQRQLLEAYVDCFNRRDWNALHQLIAIDARLEVIEAFEGKLHEAPYFSNYAAQPWEWKLSLARVDGEPVIVQWRKRGEAWYPLAAIRLWWDGEQVVRIRDYTHVEYLLKDARTEEGA